MLPQRRTGMRSLSAILVFAALAAGCASNGEPSAASGVPTETPVTEDVPLTDGEAPRAGRVLDQATATGQNRSTLRVQLDNTEVLGTDVCRVRRVRQRSRCLHRRTRPDRSGHRTGRNCVVGPGGRRRRPLVTSHHRRPGNAGGLRHAVAVLAIRWRALLLAARAGWRRSVPGNRMRGRRLLPREPNHPLPAHRGYRNLLTLGAVQVSGSRLY